MVKFSCSLKVKSTGFANTLDGHREKKRGGKVWPEKMEDELPIPEMRKIGEEKIWGGKPGNWLWA